MPWGYYELDVNYKGPNWRVNRKPVELRMINLNKTHYLVGCMPGHMFKPGDEPADLDWWWQDNSFLPHLRYPLAHNPKATKDWSRLLYRDWNMPKGITPYPEHRTRINTTLKCHSGGKIVEIADLWGGCRDTQAPKHKKLLVIRSSNHNYADYYNTTWENYWRPIQKRLDELGWEYTVRAKVAPKERKNANQITDQIREGGYSAVLANHSAGAVEALVLGLPVITTSVWNPTRSLSTTWEQFSKSGELEFYTQQQHEDWVSYTCAYTYHKQELDTLSWIDTHPQAGYLKEQRNGKTRS